jgi:hypothetical protein
MHETSGEKVAVLCFYCNYKQDSEQTTHHILSAILKQLVQSCSSLSDKIKALYTRYKSTTSSPDLDEIESTLMDEISRYELVFLILDALDELGERRRKELVEILSRLPSSFRLLATSRDVGDIDASFIWDSMLLIRASMEDLKTYIHSRVMNEKKWKTTFGKFLADDRQLEDEIVNTVAKKAEGM